MFYGTLKSGGGGGASTGGPGLYSSHTLPTSDGFEHALNPGHEIASMPAFVLRLFPTLVVAFVVAVQPIQFTVGSPPFRCDLGARNGSQQNSTG